MNSITIIVWQKYHGKVVFSCLKEDGIPVNYHMSLCYENKVGIFALPVTRKDFGPEKVVNLIKNAERLMV